VPCMVVCVCGRSCSRDPSLSASCGLNLTGASRPGSRCRSVESHVLPSPYLGTCAPCTWCWIRVGPGVSGHASLPSWCRIACTHRNCCAFAVFAISPPDWRRVPLALFPRLAPAAVGGAHGVCVTHLLPCNPVSLPVTLRVRSRAGSLRPLERSISGLLAWFPAAAAAVATPRD
jgi:hypothetical protein